MTQVLIASTRPNDRTRWFLEVLPLRSRSMPDAIVLHVLTEQRAEDLRLSLGSGNVRRLGRGIAHRLACRTDYPFEMGSLDPVESVRSTGFDAPTTDAILGATATGLLGL